MTRLAPLLLAHLLAFAPALPTHAEDMSDILSGYLDFASYTEGVILAEQITPDLMGQITLVDTRNAELFAQGSLEGAIHIEWRDVVARLDELPTSGLVVLFCDHSVLSSQAMLMARLLDRQNVLVLQGGMNAWQRVHGI
jgi:rhodanese-related sulfurtransferase